MKVSLLEDVDDDVPHDVEKLEHAHAFVEPKKRANVSFKVYVVCSMVFFWTGYTLLVRYTRTSASAAEMYASSTTILLAEALKFAVTLFFLYRDAQFSPKRFSNVVNTEFFAKPWELLKMSVPSMTYALQNNLDFVALSNLDAGVYQVTSQLKIVSTALFMMLFLRRSFSARRWMAIFLLFTGVAFVQLSKLNVAAEKSTLTKVSSTTPGVSYGDDDGPVQNQLLGMIAVLCTCATAGFAGVYFEMMLKDGSSTPFWIRNLQMYASGLVSTLIGCFVYDSESIRHRGFLHGYNIYVWLIVVFLGLGGIFISLIMKYMDNLYKSFASSIAIIFVVLFSVFLFADTQLNINFAVGAVAVCIAIVLYNSVND